jgi:hypothetical protein
VLIDQHASSLALAETLAPRRIDWARVRVVIAAVNPKGYYDDHHGTVDDRGRLRHPDGGAQHSHGLPPARRGPHWAWIVHLTESPQVHEQHGFVVELGKRLNLCLVNRQEQNGLTVELGERLRVCLVNRVEDLAKAKAAGVNLSDMPSPPGTPGK